MGCCQSAPTDDDASSRGGGGGAGVAQPGGGLASSSQPAIPGSREASSAPPPNAPLRAPSPLPTCPRHIPQRPPPWTRSFIEAERAAFFDTRVTGRKEVWDGLRTVCEFLRQGELGQAQGILDAINATCPRGRVAAGRGRDRVRGGVFDERGKEYEIPAWLVTDPLDLIEDAAEKDVEAGGGGGGVGGDGGGASLEGSDDEEEDVTARQRRRDEKGKGRQEDIGELVKVRCRLSDRGSDVVLKDVGMKQRVSVLVRRIQEHIGAKRVRLVYLGKPLSEGKTLEEQGWQKGNVLNAYVFEGEEVWVAGKQAPKASR